MRVWELKLHRSLVRELSARVEEVKDASAFGFGELSACFGACSLSDRALQHTAESLNPENNRRPLMT